MQIDLTKKEYRSLLDLLSISDWVLNSTSVGEKNEKSNQYREVVQKVLTYSKEANCSDLIEYSSELEAYVSTKEYENADYMKIIEQYEDEVFWLELASRLSLRDLIKKVGKKEYQAMGQEEKFSAHSKLEEIYGEEFQKNGIENIILEK